MTSPERILIVGDAQRQVQGALAEALPAAQLVGVGSYFDAIAELTANRYSAVVAAIEPVERRPEAAVATLRQLASDARLLLFGQATLEPLSRKMLAFGCDDYFLTPANPAEIQQVFATPPLRLSEPEVAETAIQPPAAVETVGLPALAALPLADLLLDALVQHPQDAPAFAVRQINAQLGPAMQLHYVTPDQPPPQAGAGMALLSQSLRAGGQEIAHLHLMLPEEQDQSAARHLLSQLGHLLGKLASLQDRHKRLQKLAISDDLTGLANARYFRYFLSTILERAKTLRFPVTLLMFDIDGFKRYNDVYGHGVGDEILKQTAALMRRCCRDHDLVARIGGDEFAVVFWEKEGPRQPREPKTVPARAPQTPLQILERFQQLLTTEQFRGLGAAGQGQLTISGGMAVYPYDAQDVESLIAAADRELVFRAKRGGKNCIFLVGEQPPGTEGEADGDEGSQKPEDRSQ